MTTESQVTEPSVPNTPVEGGESADRQLSPIEQRALEQGWRPKDQFQGDDAEFIDAAEFVRRGELFSKIEKQSKELKQVREALEALKQHHTKVAQTEYQRALKTLEATRRQAIVEGEVEKAFEIEDQIELVKAEKAVVDEEAKKPVIQEQSVPPQLDAWMQKNSWYQSNRAMTALADRLGAEYRSKGYTLDRALQEIDAEVRKEFPEKFAVKRPPSPEGSTRTGSVKSEVAYKMSDDERRIMRKFVANGVMTEAEYIKELKKVKEQ